MPRAQIPCLRLGAERRADACELVVPRRGRKGCGFRWRVLLVWSMCISGVPVLLALRGKLPFLETSQFLLLVVHGECGGCGGGFARGNAQRRGIQIALVVGWRWWGGDDGRGTVVVEDRCYRLGAAVYVGQVDVDGHRGGGGYACGFVVSGFIAGVFKGAYQGFQSVQGCLSCVNFVTQVGQLLFCGGGEDVSGFWLYLDAQVVDGLVLFLQTRRLGPEHA